MQKKPAIRNGKRYFKASSADIRTKKQIIDADEHLYPVSAMCRILDLSRQSYYYQSKPKKDGSELEEVVTEELIHSRKAYGSREIKKALSK